MPAPPSPSPRERRRRERPSPPSMAPSTRSRNAEKDVAKIFDAVAASVEERRVHVLQLIQDKGDHLRKTAIQEKGEAESARAEFRGFHSFTGGLLAQGTPLEIAGTHKMVRA